MTKLCTGTTVVDHLGRILQGRYIDDFHAGQVPGADKVFAPTASKAVAIRNAMYTHTHDVTDRCLRKGCPWRFADGA